MAIQLLTLTLSQLHFNNPQAFHDIYNNRNRWDKDGAFYHSFGEDESSFGFLTHQEAKERKDVLTRMFSAKAIEDAQGIVRDKVRFSFCFDCVTPAKHFRSTLCVLHSQDKPRQGNPVTCSMLTDVLPWTSSPTFALASPLTLLKSPTSAHHSSKLCTRQSSFPQFS